MSTDGLKEAIATTRGVLSEVRPDQLETSTPCASWKVSDIINHVVGGQYFFAAAMTGEQPQGDPPDFAGGDYLGAFDAGAAACVAAFEADGAMERTVTLPFGQMPGSAFLGIATTDTLTHGWDVARATGQSTDLAPALSADVLAGIRQVVGPGFRGEDGKAPFGPEQQAPAGASNADQLAAFLGRSV
jgi:uncharacterized protein (TIGR03086 family)